MTAHRDSAGRRNGAARVAAFALTLFVSALLLFWVQPLIAKLVLPRLGGSPAVWTTCMVFFQTALLAGYAWAFALDRWLTPGRQLAAQLVLLAAGAAVLPVAVAAGEGASGSPVAAVLTLLAVSIGLPVLGLSATAPLLQSWFGRSRHPHAGDPYFLYAASNLGSLGALALFPLVFERLLSTEAQGWMWSGGYLVLAALVGVCGAWVLRGGGASLGVPVTEEAAPPNWRQRTA